MRAAANSRAAQRMGAAARARRVLPVCLSHESHAEAEDAEVEAENQAISGQQQDRNDSGEVAVLRHGVANPVAVAHVPKKTAEIAEEESAADGTGIGNGRFGEDGGEERTRPNQAKTVRQMEAGRRGENGNSSRAAEMAAAAHNFHVPTVNIERCILGRV